MLHCKNSHPVVFFLFQIQPLLSAISCLSNQRLFVFSCFFFLCQDVVACYSIFESSDSLKQLFLKNAKDTLLKTVLRYKRHNWCHTFVKMFYFSPTKVCWACVKGERLCKFKGVKISYVLRYSISATLYFKNRYFLQFTVIRVNKETCWTQKRHYILSTYSMSVSIW